MNEETRVVVATTNGQVIDFGMQAVVSVDQALERIKQLQSFIAKVMVKGEDYGIIPGTGNKPSLFKPGAEKLCEMYGISPTFEVTDSVRDWEKPFIHYEVRCRLVGKNTGVIVGEGVGSCNSREKRYRNQDAYTLANTILKMAKKRAHVDATLSATRSSGIFTQDIEDIADEVRKPELVQQRRPNQTQTQQQAPTTPHEPEPTAPDNGKPAKSQRRLDLENRYSDIRGQLKARGLPAEDLDDSWTDDALIGRGQDGAKRLHADLDKEFAKASSG